ncbi:hypothetical protein D9758_006992 [Tetrapyrgos nigripes]|uniref:Uncharacterized protein n=1 Tax=Tetrapyrgos nigripes TaxID=182062 RepID=A0A8H5LUU7_9AGAR|nr:hypothetical protein D9758_006992 [Tetrapyrgos nigripes]
MSAFMQELPVDTTGSLLFDGDVGVGISQYFRPDLSDDHGIIVENYGQHDLTLRITSVPSLPANEGIYRTRTVDCAAPTEEMFRKDGLHTDGRVALPGRILRNPSTVDRPPYCPQSEAGVPMASFHPISSPLQDSQYILPNANQEPGLMSPLEPTSYTPWDELLNFSDSTPAVPGACRIGSIPTEISDCMLGGYSNVENSFVSPHTNSSPRPSTQYNTQSFMSSTTSSTLEGGPSNNQDFYIPPHIPLSQAVDAHCAFSAIRDASNVLPYTASIPGTRGVRGISASRIPSDPFNIRDASIPSSYSYSSILEAPLAAQYFPTSAPALGPYACRMGETPYDIDSLNAHTYKSFIPPYHHTNPFLRGQAHTGWHGHDHGFSNSTMSRVFAPPHPHLYPYPSVSHAQAQCYSYPSALAFPPDPPHACGCYMGGTCTSSVMHAHNLYHPSNAQRFFIPPYASLPLPLRHPHYFSMSSDPWRIEDNTQSFYSASDPAMLLPYTCAMPDMHGGMPSIPSGPHYTRANPNDFIPSYESENLSLPPSTWPQYTQAPPNPNPMTFMQPTPWSMGPTGYRPVADVHVDRPNFVDPVTTFPYSYMDAMGTGSISGGVPPGGAPRDLPTFIPPLPHIPYPQHISPGQNAVPNFSIPLPVEPDFVPRAQDWEHEHRGLTALSLSGMPPGCPAQMENTCTPIPPLTCTNPSRTSIPSLQTKIPHAQSHYAPTIPVQLPTGVPPSGPPVPGRTMFDDHDLQPHFNLVPSSLQPPLPGLIDNDDSKHRHPLPSLPENVGQNPVLGRRIQPWGHSSPWVPTTPLADRQGPGIPPWTGLPWWAQTPFIPPMETPWANQSRWLHPPGPPWAAQTPFIPPMETPWANQSRWLPPPPGPPWAAQTPFIPPMATTPFIPPMATPEPGQSPWLHPVPSLFQGTPWIPHSDIPRTPRDASSAQDGGTFDHGASAATGVPPENGTYAYDDSDVNFQDPSHTASGGPQTSSQSYPDHHEAQAQAQAQPDSQASESGHVPVEVPSQTHTVFSGAHDNDIQDSTITFVVGDYHTVNNNNHGATDDWKAYTTVTTACAGGVAGSLATMTLIGYKEPQPKPEVVMVPPPNAYYYNNSTIIYETDSSESLPNAVLTLTVVLRLMQLANVFSKLTRTTFR